MIARSLKTPILLASLLVVSGIGFAAYSASAQVTVTGSTASFEIVYTAIVAVAPPPNIQTFAVSTLPSQNPTLDIQYLLPGETLVIQYTVEDIGTVGAKNVVETVVEHSTDCDGTLALAQVGLAPTTLAPLTPVTAEFSVTDNANASVPIPPGCPTPFTAVWGFSVSGEPV